MKKIINFVYMYGLKHRIGKYDPQLKCLLFLKEVKELHSLEIRLKFI